MPQIDRGWGDDAPAFPGPPPRDNMAWAILTTLLCCLPLGVVAVVYASQVKPRWAAGEYVAAVESATRSKRWTWWGVTIGVFFWIVVGVTLWASRSVQGS